MIVEENQNEEFIIRTQYKTRIGSYLSWPTGAKEITKQLKEVPQLKALRLTFGEPYPKHPPQGKWPRVFCIIIARYSFHRTQYESRPEHIGWFLDIIAVPRSMKPEIGGALKQDGFGRIYKWLVDHASISGHEGNRRFECMWDSESKEFLFRTHDYVLPKVSLEKRQDVE